LVINVNTRPESSAADSGTSAEAIKAGLEEQVHLDKADSGATLVINKPFEQGWFILGVLLNQLALEVTDRNRDQGYYFVRYDPDIDYTKQDDYWYDIKSLFSDDNYSERIYGLKLMESNAQTEVTAQIAPANAAEPDDSAPLPDKHDDGADRLLQALFKTLRDGMLEQSRKHRDEFE
jgi:outer membrane protein assembly factor BamC